MNILFFILLSLLLIVFQTVVFPCFPGFVQCFDLLIIDVLFLSLISSHFSIIFAIVIIGCIMDSISGVPFCYHIFSYLWIYIIVNIVKQLLFQRSIIFIFIISVASVLIQQVLLLFSVFVNHGTNTFQLVDLGLLIKQVFWGFIFIPPSIWLINVFWQNWIFITKRMQKQITQKYRE